ncbi:MAG: TetR/AcrR family transcriptional regulator [Chitinispirillales bacterium]|jgi:AcrR family transcriptional regulator|nr:TetR/AcrR family transcriptional regulator [Chitinispirillales bacterium]
MEEKKEVRISKIRDSKSEFILNAALTVFSRKGIYDTNLEDIAVEAGFSKAALYNYYQNKESIIYNLYIREINNFIDKLQNSIEYSINEMQSFEENIRRYSFLAFKTFQRHFNFTMSMNLLEVFESQRKNKHTYLICQRDKYYEQGLSKIILWAKEKDEITSSFPNISLCRVIDSIITAVMLGWIKDEKIGYIEKAVEDLISLLVNGVKKL